MWYVGGDYANYLHSNSWQGPYCVLEFAMATNGGQTGRWFRAFKATFSVRDPNCYLNYLPCDLDCGGDSAG